MRRVNSYYATVPCVGSFVNTLVGKELQSVVDCLRRTPLRVVEVNVLLVVINDVFDSLNQDRQGHAFLVAGRTVQCLSLVALHAGDALLVFVQPPVLGR